MADRPHASLFAGFAPSLASTPGTRLALLSEVKNYVIPWEWLGSFPPHTRLYASRAFIKRTKRFERELNFSC